jgi:hypothetical protein
MRPPSPRRRLLVLAALAALGSPGSLPAATLTVNDLADPGTVGDAGLSLREAIRVATGDIGCSAPGGTLTCDGLSAAERSQIAGGVPGAAAADTVAFAVSGTVALAPNPGNAGALPGLTTGNDTIDGDGRIVLDGAALDLATQGGIHISSSGNTVRGLTFRDVPGVVLDLTPPAGGTIAGTRIVGNRITRPGVAGIRLLASVVDGPNVTRTGGLIDDTLIQGNTIEAGTPDNKVRGTPTAAVDVLAAYAPFPGAASGARITNLTLVGNVFQDLFQGVFARAAAGRANLADNELVGLTVRDNLFQRVNDQTLYVGASNIQGTGHGTNNVTRDVVIAGNTFRTRNFDPAAPYLGGGPFVSGGFLDGCATSDGTPTSVGDRTTGVEISNNTIQDRAPYGIYLQAAQSCGGGGGSLTGSVLENVTVTGNTVEGSGTGVSLAGGSSFQTTGPLTNADNLVRAVTVSGNTVSGNDVVGIELIGGVSNGGGADRNVLDGIQLADNVLSANRFAIAVNGGVTVGSGNAARDNRIQGLRIAGNTVQASGGYGILLQGAGVSAGSTGTGNAVEGPEISGNTFTGTKGVGVFLTPVTRVGNGRAEQNRVTGAVVASNTIRDTMSGPGGNPGAVGILLIGRGANTLGGATLDANVIERVGKTGIMLVDTVGHTISNNRVVSTGKKPFIGKKRKNTVVNNVFQRKPKPGFK